MYCPTAANPSRTVLSITLVFVFCCCSMKHKLRLTTLAWYMQINQVVAVYVNHTEHCTSNITMFDALKPSSHSKRQLYRTLFTMSFYNLHHAHIGKSDNRQ
jgi:hypothetical protein